MITVLNTLGICSSYPTLAGTQKRTGKLPFKLGSRGRDFNGVNVLDPPTTITGIPAAPTLGEEQSEAEIDPDTDTEGQEQEERDGQQGRQRGTVRTYHPVALYM